MVEHRRTPGSGISVPAGWFIVTSIGVCAAAAAWLGVMMTGTTSADTGDSSASAPTTTAPVEPAPTAAAPTATTPSPSPTPTEEPVARDTPVTVLNNTGIGGLARTYAGRVGAAGWSVAGTGNWRGQIPANTVYYPAGLQDRAELLAQDVGIARVLPSIAGMRMDRLTIILSGPQQ